ncbi:MAG TPA: ABC transporter permease subunit [Micromonosporaceae bacterium]
MAATVLSNVYVKSLRDQRRALLGWSIGIIALVVLEAALWPSIRDMPDLREFLKNYPEAMRKLFNMEDFGTGTGFLNTELFSALLPILFIVFSIGRGARAVAGEEEAGTLEALLVTPVSTARLLLQQAAALVTGAAGLGVVLYLITLVSSAAFDMGIDPGDLAAATLATVLLGVEFGLLALAVGAITGRRALAIGVASAAAVGAYVLYVAGQLVEAVRPWQPLSPFDQALHGGPLGAGLRPEYGWMALAAVVVVVVALPIFDRRDVNVR